MVPKNKVDLKADILDSCVNYCIKNGFSDLSLRTLADSIGTSHRMLIYYFLSREQLLKSILEEYRHRQIASIAEDLDSIHSVEALEKVISKIWFRLSSVEFHSFSTAFFEFYIRCVRTIKNADSQEFLKAAIDDWLDPVNSALGRLGISLEKRCIISRFLLGALRGLVLDSLVVADRVVLDHSFELLLLSLREILLKSVSEPSHS